jgi:hypothetical protein
LYRLKEAQARGQNKGHTMDVTSPADAHDALMAKEQELMRLNAELDDAAVVSLADRSLQSCDDASESVEQTTLASPENASAMGTPTNSQNNPGTSSSRRQTSKTHDQSKNKIRTKKAPRSPMTDERCESENVQRQGATGHSTQQQELHEVRDSVHDKTLHWHDP